MWNCGTYGAWISLELFGKAAQGIVGDIEEIQEPKANIPKRSLSNLKRVNSGVPRFGNIEEEIKPALVVRKESFDKKNDGFQPGNIGFASVYNPDGARTRGGGVLKPYNPPIIDVSVKR